MKSQVLRSILLTLSCCFGMTAYAETTGWTWGPFSSSTTKADTVTASKSSVSWLPQWKMPDVAGSVKKATKSVSHTTSQAWNSASRTTKRAWKKTTEILDPFPNDEKSSSLSSTSSSGGNTSWFGGSKKESKPATVQEFLRQERP